MRFWLGLALSNFRQLQINMYLKIDNILAWAVPEQLRGEVYSMGGMCTPTSSWLPRSACWGAWSYVLKL